MGWGSRATPPYHFRNRQATGIDSFDDQELWMSGFHVFDNGVKVYSHHLLATQRERYAVHNVHEADEEGVFVAALGRVPQGGCYVSIGAAIGYYPLLARLLRPDILVHCFEPLPKHVAYFRENISLNGFHEDDFRIHPVGVSHEPGSAILIDDSYGSRLLISENVTRAGNPPMISVPVIVLNDIPLLAGVEVVDLVQCDIQGLELPVLKHYFYDTRQHPESRVRTFLVGTHGTSIHDHCERLLRENGYKILCSQAVGLNQPDGVLCAEKEVCL
jgi:FkbM family methyltransferase